MKKSTKAVHGVNLSSRQKTKQQTPQTQIKVTGNARIPLPSRPRPVSTPSLRSENESDTKLTFNTSSWSNEPSSKTNGVDDTQGPATTAAGDSAISSEPVSSGSAWNKGLTAHTESSANNGNSGANSGPMSSQLGSTISTGGDDGLSMGRWGDQLVEDNPPDDSSFESAAFPALGSEHARSNTTDRHSDGHERAFGRKYDSQNAFQRSSRRFARDPDFSDSNDRFSSSYHDGEYRRSSREDDQRQFQERRPYGDRRRFGERENARRRDDSFESAERAPSQFGPKQDRHSSVERGSKRGTFAAVRRQSDEDMDWSRIRSTDDRRSDSAGDDSSSRPDSGTAVKETYLGVSSAPVGIGGVPTGPSTTVPLAPPQLQLPADSEERRRLAEKQRQEQLEAARREAELRAKENTAQHPTADSTSSTQLEALKAQREQGRKSSAGNEPHNTGGQYSVRPPPSQTDEKKAVSRKNYNVTAGVSGQTSETATTQSFKNVPRILSRPTSESTQPDSASSRPRGKKMLFNPRTGEYEPKEEVEKGSHGSDEKETVKIKTNISRKSGFTGGWQDRTDAPANKEAADTERNNSKADAADQGNEEKDEAGAVFPTAVEGNVWAARKAEVEKRRQKQLEEQKKQKEEAEANKIAKLHAMQAKSASQRISAISAQINQGTEANEEPPSSMEGYVPGDDEYDYFRGDPTDTEEFKKHVRKVKRDKSGSGDLNGEKKHGGREQELGTLHERRRPLRDEERCNRGPRTKGVKFYRLESGEIASDSPSFDSKSKFLGPNTKRPNAKPKTASSPAPATAVKSIANSSTKSTQKSSSKTESNTTHEVGAGSSNRPTYSATSGGDHESPFTALSRSEGPKKKKTREGMKLKDADEAMRQGFVLVEESQLGIDYSVEEGQCEDFQPVNYGGKKGPRSAPKSKQKVQNRHSSGSKGSGKKGENTRKHSESVGSTGDTDNVAVHAATAVLGAGHDEPDGADSQPSHQTLFGDQSGSNSGLQTDLDSEFARLGTSTNGNGLLDSDAAMLGALSPSSHVFQPNSQSAAVNVSEPLRNVDMNLHQRDSVWLGGFGGVGGWDSSTGGSSAPQAVAAAWESNVPASTSAIWSSPSGDTTQEEESEPVKKKQEAPSRGRGRGSRGNQRGKNSKPSGRGRGRGKTKPVVLGEPTQSTSAPETNLNNDKSGGGTKSKESEEGQTDEMASESKTKNTGGRGRGRGRGNNNGRGRGRGSRGRGRGGKGRGTESA